MAQYRIVLRGSASHTHARTNKRYEKDRPITSTDQAEIDYCKGNPAFTVYELVSEAKPAPSPSPAPKSATPEPTKGEEVVAGQATEPKHTTKRKAPKRKKVQVDDG